MVYLCKPIPKENVVSMFDERVAELEALLEASDARFVEANNQLTREVSKYCWLESKYRDDTNILAGVLFYLVDSCGLEVRHLNDAIEASSYDDSKVRDVLTYHEAIPEDMLKRQYYVSVTVHVTVCLTIEAADEDTAEEMARDNLESNGIECYDMEYNTYYDAEYSVTEA